MSDAEKTRYINAVYTISTDSRYTTQYNAMIRKHLSLFSSGIHNGPMFFPWHREYIWDLEELLQQVDCRVTVPYWRWSLEANTPFTSTIWSATTGFGGNGSPSGGCVASGRFASPWRTTEAGSPCLTRAWSTSASFPTEADITQALDSQCPLATQYSCVESAVESFHNYVHGSIGGTMA